MGPDMDPPRERFVYSLASACAARSVHCICGAVPVMFTPRERKLEPARLEMLRLPPLKPPRDTSKGEVTRLVDTLASRGSEFESIGRLLSVTLLSSAPSPSTEKPSGCPS